eukprot:scaffold37922_cov57-Attheya_sp.AAC.2
MTCSIRISDRLRRTKPTNHAQDLPKGHPKYLHSLPLETLSLPIDTDQFSIPHHRPEWYSCHYCLVVVSVVSDKPRLGIRCIVE